MDQMRAEWRVEFGSSIGKKAERWTPGQRDFGGENGDSCYKMGPLIKRTPPVDLEL